MTRTDDLHYWFLTTRLGRLWRKRCALRLGRHVPVLHVSGPGPWRETCHGCGKTLS